METRECKLCFKTFANGRALGGHMRSHMMKLPLPSKPEESRSPSPTLLSFEADSPSSSSSSEDEGGNGLSYVVRENTKRSIFTVDPEFSFVVDPNGSVIQDGESETETESSKKPTRKRSKRACKLGSFDVDHHHHYCYKKIQQQVTVEKLKSNELCKTESWIAEAEPASSVSDATTEEDVAYCLMMLSRDKWKRQKDLKDQYDAVEEDEDKDEEEDEDVDDEEEDDGDESEGAFKSLKSRTRGKYTCETCKKVFRSYQALGGHRASHKKIKLEVENHRNNNNGGTSSSPNSNKKIHECPICFRVFSSGQALGGHKRSHLTGSSTLSPTQAPTTTKLVENFIDLNLPAPTEEDDISQIDNSGVSEAEFFVVDRIRQ